MMRSFLAALIVCVGLGWAAPASARWYYCRMDMVGSRDLYWSDLFEIPGDFHGPTIAKVREDYASYVSQTLGVRKMAVHCVEFHDGNEARTAFNQMMSGTARGIDPKIKMIPTRWTPRMGGGTGRASTAAPAQRAASPARTPAPLASQRPTVDPTAAERANSSRLNAQQAAAARRQREEINAALAANRAAQEKYLRDKAAAAQIVRDNAARQAQYEREMVEYRRKVAEHEAIIAAQQGRKPYRPARGNPQ